MMDAKIDYLSFTVMSDHSSQAGRGNAPEDIADAISQRVPAFIDPFAYSHEWQPGGARGHYSTSLFSPDTYSAVRWGGRANHILCEMPGTACQAARDEHCLDVILAQAAERLTRLDLAVDIPNGASPRNFVAAGYNARFKSHAEIVSAEGETEYVGSMKSERFARVYRYNAPHPRAGTLRVEYVLRSSYAKQAAAEMTTGGATLLAALCGNTWGWLASDWQPGTLTDGNLKAKRSDRHEPGRIRWLHQVCIPAISRASREGLLDLDAVIVRLRAL